MMKKLKEIFLLLVCLSGVSVFSQSKLTGVVSDESGPLPSADVYVNGTSKGMTTDFDGNFTLEVPAGSGELVVSYVGYKKQTIPYTVAAGATKRFGTIVLEADVEAMEEIVIVGSGIIDLAKDRKTPIAVSTIKASEIVQQVGNSDLPELLKSTPSVQSLQGGGFGDGQMFLRGFDQTNTAFLLNGQPINGMEDGKMYWSNWSGVLDIANAVQVQRGLGSSKLAISSVGGTVNIVTKTVDKKEGGFVQAMVANNNYIKTNAYYSTGLSDKGWSFSTLLGHWQGDGYRDGAEGQGQTYFFSVGYKANENSIFNFLVTGAPQWHNSGGFRVKLEDYLENGIRYNNNFDYINGGRDIYSRGRNFYHKPVLNFSWDYQISDVTSLSTVAYGSFGRGGFATYSGFDWSQGQHSLDDQIADPNQTPYVKASMNNHNWFGAISNLKTELNDNVTLNFGIDGRLYNGKHYRQLIDNFGQGPITQFNNPDSQISLTEGSGFSPWDALFDPVTSDDEKFSRNYQEWINYIGAFGQLEYTKDKFSSFFQGAISNQSYQREGFLIQNVNQTGLGKGDKVNKIGYNVKAGAAYDVADGHKVFANAGYYSRQPFLDNIYESVRYEQNLIDPEVDNEDILGLELGYKFTNYKNFTANLNVYYTQWGNRTLQTAFEDQVTDIEYGVTIRGLEQTHTGVELDMNYRPIDKLKLNGFLSVGNWEYTKNATIDFYNDGVFDPAQSGDYYLDGVKVGEAAQFTAGFGANYEVNDRLSIKANTNFIDELYGNVGVNVDSDANDEFLNADNQGAVKLPSYTTVDAGFVYKIPVGKAKNDVQLIFNVRNLFEEEYIENASTNIHTDATSTNWKGVNVENRVNFGYGRTWNLAFRFNF